jgi:hypothetical protein
MACGEQTYFERSGLRSVWLGSADILRCYRMRDRESGFVLFEGLLRGAVAQVEGGVTWGGEMEGDGRSLKADVVV